MTEPHFTPQAAARLTSTPEAFRASCEEAMGKTKAQVEQLKAARGTLPSKELLSLYDSATATLSDALACASVARESHPEAAFREAADACEQMMEKLATDIALDRGVWEALKGLEVKEEEGGTRYFVEKTLRDFRRAGVDKEEAVRQQVKALNEELVKIGQEFGRNIREDVRHIEVEAKALEGLPVDYQKAHPPQANGKVRITTDTPDYLPFMTYAKDARAREALWKTYRLRGHPKNLDVLQRLLTQRHKLATLLGYPSWAAYVTEDKMIRSPQNAEAFIERIAKASGPRAQADYQTLLKRKQKEDKKAKQVNPWDQPYLEDKVKAETYAFNSQAVRPYFEYSRVKQGVLSITAQLFGLRYQRREDAPVWHKDIEAYDVYEKDTLLGRFYLDMHPRENKYKHAAQFTLATGQAKKRYPEAVLICNFPKPGEQPALMQHSEVETFFHEFGHLLHHILGGHTQWAGLSGVRTEWDFVEAPSQLLEEWGWDVSVLQSFAKHYETGEPLPEETVKRMKAANEFGKGLWVRQQMFYAALSLQLYSRPPEQVDSTALVKEMQELYTPFEYVPDTYFHLSFGHLDGYSAIYYTYMWSLVIAKDLFTRFQKEGLMSEGPAQAYRGAVLAQGGSKEAARLVQDFLGRDYRFDAYEQWLNAG